MLNVKQGGIKYHFKVFGMTRPGIEPQAPGPLVNILLIRPNLRTNRKTKKKRVNRNRKKNNCMDISSDKHVILLTQEKET